MFCGCCTLFVFKNFGIQKPSKPFTGIDMKSGWKISGSEEDFQVPANLISGKVTTPVTLYHTLPKPLHSAMLYITSGGESYRLFIGKREIFNHEGNPKTRSKSLKLLSLDDEWAGQRLSIVFDEKIPFGNGYTPLVRIGTIGQLIQGYFERHQWEILLGGACLFLGAVMILVRSIGKGKFPVNSKITIYFGLICILVGVGLLCDTHLIGIMSENFELNKALRDISMFFIMFFWFEFLLLIAPKSDEGKNGTQKAIRLIGLVQMAAAIAVMLSTGPTNGNSYAIYPFAAIACGVAAEYVLIKNNHGKKKELLAVVITFSVFIVVSVTAGIFYNIRQYRFITPFLFVCFATYLYTGLLQLEQDRIQAAQAYDLYENELSYQQQLRSALKSMRVFRHDARNHLLVLSHLQKQKEYGRLEQYLSELKGQSDEADAWIDTGNPALDALLTQKQQEINKAGVRFEIKLNIPPNLCVKGADWCMMLGNALDNALEATKRCDHMTGAKIVLCMTYRIGILVGTISNSATKECATAIKSSKTNKGEHGLGRKSMQMALDRYDGRMKFCYKDGKAVLEFELFGLRVHEQHGHEE